MHDFGPFDLAFANEGLARALVTNDPSGASEYLTKAREVGEDIEKEEDRQWLHTNLDEVAEMIDAN
jgi:hypothetical protein